MADVKPENIAAFLFDRMFDTEKTLLVKTDSTGQITEIRGNRPFYDKGLETGKSLPDFFPFLHSFFPAEPMPPADLPRIHWKNRYLNVSVFQDNDLTAWFLLTDTTDLVTRMEPHIQKNNSVALARKKKSAFDNPFEGLHLFSVASFIRTDKGKFIFLGTLPEWIDRYFPQIGQNNGETDLTEVFPYLDVFLPEAETFWETEKETLLGSDIWIETPDNNTELHLRAFATVKNGNRYLLIRHIEDDDVPMNQHTIQKAREHQLLYEKLEKAEKKLKQLLYYKDKFVSIVSHDLRSPMASVVSVAEMLLTDDELMDCMSDFNREMLYSMKEELQRLLEYNNRLYHWSNLELGNFKLDKEKISVRKLINDALRTSKTKMEAKNIRYTTVVPEDFEMELDVSLFLQVLNNLLGNAVKFTPQNGEITIGVTREQDTVKFFVSDTGVGMPIAMQKSVFAGVPNESTLGTDGEKGSGLGLDIIRKIVEAHGFTIAVESKVGKGTTFTITATQ
jgi:signal transduction histidine kinase